MRTIRDLILICCLLFACFANGCTKSTRELIKTKAINENARVFKMNTKGMLPTLTMNQRFAADCSSYKNHTPQRGEIVVFTHPAVRMTGTGVKRVIAIGGDIIEIKADNVLLNNALLKEPYILENSNSSIPGDIAPTKIPEGHVFVMGDNRSNSFDSRMWGDKFLPVENIEPGVRSRIEPKRFRAKSLV